MSLFTEQNYNMLLENPDLMAALEKITVYKKYQKHQLLSQAGSICDYLYIIVSGVARVFYFNEHKDVTVHISMEQETITAIDSYIQRKKSKYNIEALEDLEVMAISHNDLENLFEDNPQYERFGRLFMQQIYMDLCERLDNLQLHTAQERYAILMNTRPELLQRVPLKHLASFLSVTPETLSRIRGK
jgi:CRP-like cAMP-binding protein